jgi:hypothetical protein
MSMRSATLRPRSSRSGRSRRPVLISGGLFFGVVTFVTARVIAQHWSTHVIFLALAIPAFVSTLFMFLLRWTKIERAGQHF